MAPHHVNTVCSSTFPTLNDSKAISSRTTTNTSFESSTCWWFDKSPHKVLGPKARYMEPFNYQMPFSFSFHFRQMFFLTNYVEDIITHLSSIQCANMHFNYNL